MMSPEKSVGGQAFYEMVVQDNREVPIVFGRSVLLFGDLPVQPEGFYNRHKPYNHKANLKAIIFSFNELDGPRFDSIVGRNTKKIKREEYEHQTGVLFIDHNEPVMVITRWFRESKDGKNRSIGHSIFNPSPGPVIINFKTGVSDIEEIINDSSGAGGRSLEEFDAYLKAHREDDDIGFLRVTKAKPGLYLVEDVRDETLARHDLQRIGNGI